MVCGERSWEIGASRHFDFLSENLVLIFVGKGVEVMLTTPTNARHKGSKESCWKNLRFIGQAALQRLVFMITAAQQWTRHTQAQGV